MARNRAAHRPHRAAARPTAGSSHREAAVRPSHLEAAGRTSLAAGGGRRAVVPAEPSRRRRGRRPAAWDAEANGHVNRAAYFRSTPREVSAWRNVRRVRRLGARRIEGRRAGRRVRAPRAGRPAAWFARQAAWFARSAPWFPSRGGVACFGSPGRRGALRGRRRGALCARRRGAVGGGRLGALCVLAARCVCGGFCGFWTRRPAPPLGCRGCRRAPHRRHHRGSSDMAAAGPSARNWRIPAFSVTAEIPRPAATAAALTTRFVDISCVPSGLPPL